MAIPKPTTVDFETFGIDKRPDYAPVPVGVSIKEWGKAPKYYAWGHISDNNCTYEDGRRAVAQAYKNKDGILCQNGKFDVEVAQAHLGLELLPWHKIHDTLFLLFLDDPHQRSLDLKSSSERLLGMPKEEQDALAEWLTTRQPVPGVTISTSKTSEHYFMKYLAFAPGGLVGKYANGDVVREEKLFKLLYAKTVDRGMLEAYDRERRLMPILLGMEQEGVPVDEPRLTKDVALYQRAHDDLSHWIRKTLKAPELNIGSGQELARALLKAGMADEALMGYTASSTPDKPKIQTNKDALKRGVTHPVMGASLRYLAALGTCLNTFMKPWQHVAQQCDGLIYTTWNQTKATDGDSGTKSGRLSSTPNFQNIPNEFKPIWYAVAKELRTLPRMPITLPNLPYCRSYVVPLKGEVLIDRDYSQQEPRILAHFDGGQLLRTYLENPWVDFHDYAKEALEQSGLFYERKPVKNTNLGLIYGMGAGKLADKNEMTVEEASVLKKAILELYPGLKAMYKEMKRRAQAGEPITTWGGREYYCEPPQIIRGRVQEFDYKMVNQLIQGSAGDCTKEAMIRYAEAKPAHHRMLISVHDELLASVPKKEVKSGMKILKDSMESVEFDVPMLSEGEWSETNWFDLKDYDKKGKLVYAH